MEEYPMQGNSYLDQLLGANIYLIPIKASYQKEIHPRMVTLADHLRSVVSCSNRDYMCNWWVVMCVFGWGWCNNPVRGKDAIAHNSKLNWYVKLSELKMVAVSQCR